MKTTRAETLMRLATEEFDLLVIGGGATGCGIALDAASRGLKTALVERYDYAEGTSGRSTKLIHGGVRYLEKAVRDFDRAQYNLVREGLAERRIILSIAPHLARPLPIVTPIYRTLDIPYIWAGLKLYDALSGAGSISKSKLLGAKDAIAAFPAMSADNLKAGVLYSDGQFNDSRMIVALVQTAEALGASCANHLEVVGFEKSRGKIRAAQVKDNYGDSSFNIRAKGFINASGPFCEAVRRLDDPSAAPMVTCSTGVHIALDKSFAPGGTALLIPKTEDGRILFVIPWEGGVIAGTNDNKAEPSPHPKVEEEEVDYILRHLGCHLHRQPKRSDVLSKWSGIRPLLSGGAAKTEALVREHRIEESEGGLMTIVGGKWTSYRRMARDAVDAAIAHFDLRPTNGCQTDRIVLVGSKNFSTRSGAPFGAGIGKGPELRLRRTYGDRAELLVNTPAFGKPLGPDMDIFEEEVLWAVREEYALRPLDFLCRRTPLALLNCGKALETLDRVAELMGRQLVWDKTKTESEKRLAKELLTSAL